MDEQSNKLLQRLSLPSAAQIGSLEHQQQMLYPFHIERRTLREQRQQTVDNGGIQSTTKSDWSVVSGKQFFASSERQPPILTILRHLYVTPEGLTVIVAPFGQS